MPITDKLTADEAALLDRVESYLCRYSRLSRDEARTVMVANGGAVARAVVFGWHEGRTNAQREVTAAMSMHPPAAMLSLPKKLEEGS